MSSVVTNPIVPPFTRETAILKVRAAEDAWNTRDPERVSMAYSVDSRWRNRSEFVNGREEIVAFLTRKWARELEYRLIKELWSFDHNRIAVRFAYESHDAAGQWWRSYGNEMWEFGDDGLMHRRHASINDLAIEDSKRKYHWLLGRRPDDCQSALNIDPLSASKIDPPWRLVPVVHRGDPRGAECPSRG